MSRRTEDITRPTIANIYMCVSNLAEVTSELSTDTQELTTKLLEFQMNQEKANTDTELNYKLSQIADTIGEKITENVEVIASDMTRFVDEVVNKAFNKVMSEINKTKGETWTASAIRKICIVYVTYLRQQHLLLDSNPSKLQENVIALRCSQCYRRALELTFSHPFKDVLKILQIDCTSPEISEDEAKASSKKHGRKKLYVPEMAFRSEEAIRIIEQIDHAIRVDESGEKSSGRVQPDKCIHINQENKRYSSLANKTPKFKINKLPSWAYIEI
ncbi:6922_t:CDS:2 [Dentiscutata erythropus]|uniref:6922_t:CDS:1 n=1 Tax=Dentiscutata erythropus TaxID=1348616 RepID=A0A9N9H7H5_9GLOM|nr:6922_t:CDS:2 [Dentiscutata erythropus]